MSVIVNPFIRQVYKNGERELLHLSTDFSELWLYFKSGIKMSLKREKVALSISRTIEPHPQRTAGGTPRAESCWKNHMQLEAGVWSST